VRLLLILILSWSGVARAEDVERSRAHYKAAISYFDAGQYEKALGEFESAAQFSPRPEFEFNIARCYEMMGKAELAIQRFEHYLQLRPESSDRPEVEARMGRLKQQLERERSQKLVTPAVVVEAPPKKRRVGLWVGIGVGAAVVVGTAVTLGVVFGTRTTTDHWAAARSGCVAPCTVEDLR
jgi:tetratricopeptide (TPR) repeat protein